MLFFAFRASVKLESIAKDIHNFRGWNVIISAYLYKSGSVMMGKKT